MSSKEWLLPLNLAIAFHVLVAVGTVYLPDIFKSQPKFEDIYTVDLINIADVPQSEPDSSPPAQPEKVEEAEVVPKNAVSIAQSTPVATEEPKAISLKPSKRKIKKKVPEKESTTQPDLSELRRQQLAEMIRAEQAAAEQAKILAEEAELEKRLAEAARMRLEKVKGQGATASSSAAPRSSSSSQLTALENQYYTRVISKLQQYWSLPEYTVWNPNLQAILIITVDRDGTISASSFESKSGNRLFDRFVTKALQDAGQLPPIPAAMKTQRMELGLRFTPGGINN